MKKRVRGHPLDILEHGEQMYAERYSSYEQFMEEEAIVRKRLEAHGKEWVATREKTQRTVRCFIN